MWHLAHADSGPEGEGPGARHGHSAIVHDQAMWVFGGMCDLQARNDFWKWSFGNFDTISFSSEHEKRRQSRDRREFSW